MRGPRLDAFQNLGQLLCFHPQAKSDAAGTCENLEIRGFQLTAPQPIMDAVRAEQQT
jgi:hypothetical protein